MKSVLMVWGGWKGHEPGLTTVKLAEGLARRGMHVELSHSLDSYLSKKRYDVIVQNWTMGEISPKQLSGLLSKIKDGTGFAGCHGGAGDSFRSAPEYQFMTGGQWVAHPGGMTVYKVHIVKPRDPVVKGLKDFKVSSEQYYMHVDPSNEVLAETVFSGESAPWIKGCRMPVAWKRRYGKGRVFYSSIGHSPADFDIPEVFELTMRGIIWAAG